MKKYLIKRVLSCVPGLILMLSLTGCGSPAAPAASPTAAPAQAEAVTLNITMDQGSSNGLTALTEAFMETYPNVTVNISFLSWENLAARVGDDDVSDPVDGFMISFREELYTEKFLKVWREKCEDFAETGIVDLTRFNQGALNALNAEGHQYGLPLTTSSYGLIANKTLLEKCGITKMPETTQEFLDACDIVAQHGYRPVCCSATTLPYLVTAIVNHELMMQGKEDEFVDAALTTGAVGEYYRNAITLITTLVSKGYYDVNATALNPEANGGEGAEERITSYKQECYAFLNGDVAFYPEYTDIVSSLQKREKKSAAFLAAPFEYGFIPAPTENGASTLQTGSYGLYAVKSSKNIEWMNRFIQFVFAQNDVSPVGNVSYFSDNQFAMSPFDTSDSATETSRKYFSDFLSVYQTAAKTCPADYDKILAYHGYGVCTGPLFDLFEEQDVLAMDTDMILAAINSYMENWFVKGNIKE